MEYREKLVCRTCMEGAGEPFNIFEPLNGVNIAEILKLWLFVEITANDHLPHQICKECCMKIEEFEKFRKQAVLVDKRLRQPNPVTQCDAQNIKEEDFSDADHFDDIDDVPLAKYDIDLKLEKTDTDNATKNMKTGKKAKAIGTMQASDMSGECKIWLDVNNIKSEQDLTEHLLNSTDSVTTKKDMICAIEQEKTFTCNICKTDFTNKISLNAHSQIHVQAGEVFSCNVCNKLFKKLSHLKRHAHVHRKKLIKNEEEITIKDRNISDSTQTMHKCDECPAVFKNPHSVIAHKRIHANPKRILSCSICQKVFKKISHLKRHENIHTEKRIHKCNLCPKSFSSEAFLAKHLASHETQANKCTECGKTFTQKSSLVVHLRIHRGEQPVFLCPVCGKNFNCNSNMKAHMKRHLRLKAFACEVCPKKFVSKGELKSHRVTHTGLRAFACERCGAAFTKSTSLTKHVQRLHLRLRPHPCDACDMRFSTRDHLKRHQRIHTGEKPYRCALCERAFTQSGDLLKHTRTHLGDKLYSCLVCGERFRLKAELSLHLTEHRPAKPRDPDLKPDAEPQPRPAALVDVT